MHHSSLTFHLSASSQGTERIRCNAINWKMWQSVVALVQVCKIQENYHVTTDTLNLRLRYIKKVLWDQKTNQSKTKQKEVRRAEAWNGKLKLCSWSLPVESRTLPFTSYVVYSFACFSAPKEPWPSVAEPSSYQQHSAPLTITPSVCEQSPWPLLSSNWVDDELYCSSPASAEGASSPDGLLADLAWGLFCFVLFFP